MSYTSWLLLCATVLALAYVFTIYDEGGRDD